MILGSCDQNALHGPYILGIYNRDLASDVFWGVKLRLLMLMLMTMMRTKVEAQVLIYLFRKSVEQCNVLKRRLPQALLYKPYSYCKRKLGCQVQNVLGEAFQVDNRWRSVQVSSVHFRGKSLLKMTIILFTRAPTCCVSFIHSKY